MSDVEAAYAVLRETTDRTLNPTPDTDVWDLAERAVWLAETFSVLDAAARRGELPGLWVTRGPQRPIRSVG
jgi:hypothetical protein